MGKYEDNPWLGLESYQENQIIYGRNKEIEELSQCVLNNNETVLYGKSGIGKSSIINAGILPIVRAHGYFPIVVRLDHSNKHSYIKQLSDLIKKGAHVSECTIAKPIEEQLLWEYFHTHRFNKTKEDKSKLVIIFDQFEEIFTLQNNAAIKGRFFKELGDVLNNVMPKGLAEEYPVEATNSQSGTTKLETVSGFADMADLFSSLAVNVNTSESKYIKDNEIHFVFTLREDFLSEFEYHTSKIPSLKQHRYGLRPLNEEQAAEVILKPRPELVDEGVARLIIETVTNRIDFSLGDEPEIDVDAAVLSLYLNRLYDAKEGDVITKELVEQKRGEIISEFYYDALSSISDSTIEYLEDMLLNGQGRRDNITVYDAINDGKVSENELKILCDEKKILRLFNYAGDLRIEYVHDILCPVVKNHKEERILLKLHEEERRIQEELQKQLLLEEETKRKEIERKAAEEKKRLLDEAVRIKKKNRRRLAYIGILVAFVSIFVLSWWYFIKFEYSECYGNFTTINGWPVGLGDKINESATKDNLVVHYRLTRKGRLKRENSPFYKVEVLDANGNPHTNKFYETPIVRLLEKELDDEKAAAFAELQQNTSYWIYSPGDTDYKEVARCTAYNIKKRELYSIQYFKDRTFAGKDESKYVQWAVFNDMNGKQMMVTDNGADRMRQTVNNGVVTGCLFFTELGTPQRNAYEAYGYQYEVNDKTNQVTRQYCIDKFGAIIDSTIIDFYEYKYGRVIHSSLYEVKYPKPGIIVYHSNNFNDSLLFNNNGTLGYGSFHTLGGDYSKIVFKYNENNQPLLSKRYSNNFLVSSKSYVYKTGEIDSISVFENGISYVAKYSYPDSCTTEISFWKEGNAFSKICTNEFKDNHYYHKSITTQRRDSLYLIETTEYLDSVGKPISQLHGNYAKYIIQRDADTKNIHLEYFFDANQDICKSEWFDYDEYGNRIARAVAGIDGTPVRCPNWDWDGLSFYKMAVLYPFNNKDRSVYASTKGLNEFNENSNILKINSNELHNLSITDIPYHYIYTHESIIETGVAFAGTIYNKSNYKYPAYFLHILSKMGTFYKSGLKDGDVIVKVNNISLFPINEKNFKSSFLKDIENHGGIIVVARAVPKEKKFKLLKFIIPQGNVYAEIHPIDLTEVEYNRLKNNI